MAKLGVRAPRSNPKTDRKIDALAASGTHADAAPVLVGRQHLVENGPERDLAPGTAGLDVGEHALEVADAGGELLHLADALVDLLQLIADEPKAFAQPLLQRALQLLVHGAAHVVQLGGVVPTKRVKAALDGFTQAF